MADLWLDEYEEIGKRVSLSEIEIGEFESRMAVLGFEPDEMADHWAACLSNNCPGGSDD